jgi:hypothetical protein
MGKIGNFEYPELKVDDAIKSVKIFKEKLNGTTNSLDALAGLWGHKSSKSGTFLTKLADLRKYGLITGRGELKLTSLAEAIIYPQNESELSKNLKEMIFNVELWRTLYERLGGKMPTQDFWIILQEVAGIDRGTAQKEAEKISKLYVDTITKLKVERVTMPTTMGEIPLAGVPTQEMIELKSGDIYMRLPKSKSNIDLVISALNNLKSKLIEEKAKKTETEHKK